MRTVFIDAKKLPIGTFRLLSSEVMSVLSSQIMLFSIPVIAISVLNASAAEVGLINTFSGAGTLVFLIFFMPIADSGRKEVLLSLFAMFRFLVAGTTTYFSLLGELSFFVLSGAAFLLSGASDIYDCTFSSFLPRVIERKDLSRINSWVAGLRSAADIAAGALAGVVLTVGGPVSVLFLISLLYLLSCWGPISFISDISRKINAGNEEKPTKRSEISFIGLKILMSDLVIGH